MKHPPALDGGAEFVLPHYQLNMLESWLGADCRAWRRSTPSASPSSAGSKRSVKWKSQFI